MISRQEKAKEIEEAAKKEAEKKLEEEIRLETENRPLFLNLEDSATASPWKGRNLKVIVKVSHEVYTQYYDFGRISAFFSGRKLYPTTLSDLRRDLAYGRHGGNLFF